MRLCDFSFISETDRGKDGWTPREVSSNQNDSMALLFVIYCSYISIDVINIDDQKIKCCAY